MEGLEVVLMLPAVERDSGDSNGYWGTRDGRERLMRREMLG